MLNLTNGERDFIRAGGIIWCIKMNSEKTWDIYKVTWEYIDTLNFSAASEAAASHWAYLLADLSMPEEKVTLHHSIKRLYGDEKYPCIAERCDESMVTHEADSAIWTNFLRKINKLFQRSPYRSMAGLRFSRQKEKGSSLPLQPGG